MVILFDDGTIVCDKYFFATNDSTNGGSWWEFDIANRPANHFRRGFITVCNSLDGFCSATTQRRYVNNISTTNVRQ